MLFLLLVKSSGDEVSSLTSNCPTSVGLQQSPILKLFKCSLVHLNIKWYPEDSIQQPGLYQLHGYNFSCAHFVFKHLSNQVSQKKKKIKGRRGEGNSDSICGNIMDLGLPICFFPLNFQVNSPEQGYCKFLTALHARFANCREFICSQVCFSFPYKMNSKNICIYNVYVTCQLRNPGS